MFTPGRHSHPKITQDGRDGDEIYGHIEGITDGTVIGYKYFDFKGVSEITVRTRAYFSGKFEIMTSWDGEPIGSVRCWGTNIWWSFKEKISIPDGVSALYLRYVGSGNPQLWGIELG